MQSHNIFNVTKTFQNYVLSRLRVSYKHLRPSESSLIYAKTSLDIKVTPEKLCPSPSWPVPERFHTLHVQMLIQPYSRYEFIMFYVFSSYWEKGEKYTSVFFGSINLLFSCYIVTAAFHPCRFKVFSGTLSCLPLLWERFHFYISSDLMHLAFFPHMI